MRWSWLVALGLLGCQQKSECEEACLRVARCRQEARAGDKMLGERDLPPDARCMKRCQDQHDEWQKCEHTQRSCEALRNCYGPLQ